MGKDTHAVSAPAQRTALEVLAANGIDAIIQRDDGVTPTPVISRAILVHNRERTRHLADGIVVTPSHNPPEGGGFKYNPPHGGLADTDVTGWIEERANAFLRDGNVGVRRGPHAKAITAATTRQEDFVLPYVRDLENVVDLAAIRGAGLRLAVDPLGGAAGPYWEPINSVYKLDIAVVSPVIDPTFSFMTVDHDGKIRMDPSSPYAMARLVDLKDRFRVAFANDEPCSAHQFTQFVGAHPEGSISPRCPKECLRPLERPRERRQVRNAARSSMHHLAYTVEGPLHGLDGCVKARLSPLACRCRAVRTATRLTPMSHPSNFLARCHTSPGVPARVVDSSELKEGRG